jgi:acyl-CoA dehydrogenase
VITEPSSSDARNIRMLAVRDGDEWVINGEKTFITAATSPTSHGLLHHRQGEGRQRWLARFLVDREAGWTSARS